MSEVNNHDDLMSIEKIRIMHVAKAMENALLAHGTSIDDLGPDALRAAASAAISAADRFPEIGWPFDTDLNKPPAKMHLAHVRAFQEIDAGVFSGDSFHNSAAHLYLAAHIQRWSKELRLRRVCDPEVSEEPAFQPS